MLGMSVQKLPATEAYGVPIIRRRHSPQAK